MEKLKLDTGVREYRLGKAGVLRFNPGDPNVYARFMESADKLRNVEKEMNQAAAALPETEAAVAAVQLMAQADAKMKEVLNWVFGCGNDFPQILAGVNLLAVADNSPRVITNLFAVLEPVLVAGARRCANTAAQAAAAKAAARRGSL